MSKSPISSIKKNEQKNQPFVFSFSLVESLNKKCSISNLINYFKIGIFRTYLQVTLLFCLLYFLSAAVYINYLEKPVDEITQIYLFVVIYFFVLCACSAYCILYTLYLCNTINSAISLAEENKIQYNEIPSGILIKIKKSYTLGIVIYCVFSFVSALIVLSCFKEKLDLNERLFFCSFISFISLLISWFWNTSNYYADKNIDWGYIIKNIDPTFSISAGDSKKEKHKEKFNNFYSHTRALAFASFVNIVFSVICFFVVVSFSDLEFEFFDNAYILFFIGVCYKFYKTSYNSYYKKENEDKKIYPHITDF